MPVSIDPKNPIDAVEALAPLILAHSSEGELKKRLPIPVATALRDAGFFRMFRPRSRGGLEFDPVTEFKVAEALAQIDSAVAWNVQVSNVSEIFGGWFGDEASLEIFGSPTAVVAGAFNPHRCAVPENGGYRVTGRSIFNSNCQNATWMIGLADVFDGDTMRVRENGAPETLLTMIPIDEVEIVENWNTLGMCGTGSHDIDVAGVFVPAARAVPFGPLAAPSPAYDAPLYRIAIWTTVGSHAAVAMGIAQAAIDDLVKLGSKVPAYTENAIQNRSVVQQRLARAQGKLAAARAFFFAAYDNAWAAIQNCGRLEMQEKAECQLASSTVVLTAAEVVDSVHSCIGTTGILNEKNFQRYFRDAHVITQHAFVCETRLESVGQIMFGLEPDWGFFDF